VLPFLSNTLISLFCGRFVRSTRLYVTISSAPPHPAPLNVDSTHCGDLSPRLIFTGNLGVYLPPRHFPARRSLLQGPRYTLALHNTSLFPSRVLTFRTSPSPPLEPWFGIPALSKFFVPPNILSPPPFTQSHGCPLNHRPVPLSCRSPRSSWIALFFLLPCLPKADLIFSCRCPFHSYIDHSPFVGHGRIFLLAQGRARFPQYSRVFLPVLTFSGGLATRISVTYFSEASFSPIPY